MHSCDGTNHDFRFPIRREYAASTNGAHNSFKLYGKSTMPNLAYTQKQLKNQNIKNLYIFNNVTGGIIKVKNMNLINSVDGHGFEKTYLYN